MEMLVSLIFNILFQCAVQVLMFFLLQDECWYTDKNPREGKVFCVTFEVFIYRSIILGKRLFISSWESHVYLAFKHAHRVLLFFERVCCCHTGLCAFSF